MRKTTLFLLVGVVLAALAHSAVAAEDATKGKAKAEDVCKGCVAPYNPAAERVKFFKAAGVDNELDATEFETDKARKGAGFVRAFDTWRAMLAFDKNTNKTIDWFEADAYRRDLRTRVLTAYDTNEDKHLKGKEREAANAALAAGRVPGGGGQTGGRYSQGWQMNEQTRLRMFDKDKDGKLGVEEKAAADKWQADAAKRREEWAERSARYRQLNEELVKKHDANGNGRIDADEREAYYAEYRERAKIIQWDKDNDGKLSDAERQAMETQQAEWKKRSEEARWKYTLQRWDADKDGKMSAEETAAKEAQEAEWKQRAEQYRREQEELRKQHDADGDGQLNADERKAYYDAIRAKWELRQWDKNKDGKLDEAETKARDDQRAAQRRRSEEYRRKWELQRWDKNKDGELDEAEIKARDDQQAEQRRRSEEYRRKLELRRWDKNKDGELDDAERKTMEAERPRWGQGGSVTVTPMGGGGRFSGDVRVRGGVAGQPIIIRRAGPGQDPE
ncbi:MAG: hypothetical protein ISS78_07885 [Phycisphaerae bacterium]|nr:hypothetical protein [Phycisphaerae bacterium]